MELDITKKITDSINESIEVKERVLEECIYKIETCGKELAETIINGGKILICGNGGSAADSQHIAAELVIRLRGHINRPAIRAMALTVDTSILTAGGNDIGFDNIFSREIESYGDKNDALIAISTSGNSPNVMNAVKKAKEMDLITIGLLGKDGGKILKECDYSVVVPSDNTARIQESHIMIAHIWCEMIEEILFPEFFI